MENFLICLLCGFIAQMIDGTLGMAYGVSSSTLLRAMGMSSAMASFSTHTAEIFTTLVSGISHVKMKNFDRRLFIRLLLPGVLGGVIGAYVITSFDDSVISPLVSLYLVVIGIMIFRKAFRKSQKTPREIGHAVYPLALVGGFSDSIGGGGWGPVVTSTLLAINCDIRKTIGTVNSAEFFVTFAESATFFFAIGSFDEFLPAVLGLIIGGIIAAPIAALICKKVPTRPLIAFVGLFVVAINLWKFAAAFF